MVTKGLVQVYTGDGKGKTTAAVGLACRARGHGLSVCFISFHKTSVRWGQGERRMLRALGVAVHPCAACHPSFDRKVSSAAIRTACLHAVSRIKKLFLRDAYDLYVLDEVLIAVRDGFLTEAELTALIQAKPAHAELVLTGRGAPRAIQRSADLVSEIKDLKHPFKKGVPARKGIDY